MTRAKRYTGWFTCSSCGGEFDRGYSVMDEKGRLRFVCLKCHKKAMRKNVKKIPSSDTVLR